MPHTLVTARGATVERSLGRIANWWMEEFVVHGRGGVTGMPVVHGPEMEDFIYYCYALDENGENLHDSAFYSRPKGADKSGLGARLALFEACGPNRFAGWAKGGEVFEFLGREYEYEPDEPMGKRINNPLVRIMATEEKQTGNTFDSIYYNLHPDNRGTAPLAQLNDYAGMVVNKGQIKLPWAGEIIVSTANAASKDGALESFCVFDESHLYNSRELKEMYSTVTRNVAKRVDEGSWYLETTTMYAIGEESIAEQNYEYMNQILEGDENVVAMNSMLFDHRYSELTEEDFYDPNKLLEALNESYGEIALDNGGWKNIRKMLPSLYKPVGADEKNVPRFFLNVPGAQSGANWLQPAEFSAVTKPIGLKDIALGEVITLGFDGAINRDATVLMGCRVSDGHLFLVHYKEKPDGPEGKDWKVDPAEFDAKVEYMFDNYRVRGFFADPAYWRETIEVWEKKHSEQLSAQATKTNIISFDMSLTGMVSKALNRLYVAIQNNTVSITDHSFVRRQFLNAISSERYNGQMIVEKPTKASTKTIDSIYAGMLAFEARARLLGLTNEYSTPPQVAKPRRAKQLM